MIIITLRPLFCKGFSLFSSVPYGDVKAYKLIRQGSALRLLLSGDWVAHPSGFHFVDINRPFMAGTLDALEEQILEILRAHHVKQAKK